MKHVLLLLTFLIFTAPAFSQTIYATHDGRLIRNQLDVCSLTEVSRFTSFSRNSFAIDENGLFFTLSPQDDNQVLAQLTELSSFNSLAEPKVKNHGPYTLPPGVNQNIVGAASVGNDTFYFCTSTAIFRINLSNNLVLKLPNFVGNNLADLAYVDGALYAQLSPPFPAAPSFLKIIELNPVTGSILDTLVMEGPAPNSPVSLGGLASGWQNDCTDRHLISPFTYFGSSFDSTQYRLGSVELTGGTLSPYCELFSRSLPSSAFETFDAATWETHRQTCEVRLDLDANDSQGRAGPHYRNVDICTTLFPLVDDDVQIWTIDDRPVDSMVVTITDYGLSTTG